MKNSIASIAVLCTLICAVQAKAEAPNKVPLPSGESSEEVSYTDAFGLGHTYKLGDRVLGLPRVGFGWYEGVVDAITSTGSAHVKYVDAAKNDKYSMTYQDLSVGIVPFKPVSEYTAGVFSKHTYHIGDRVTASSAKFTDVPSTIEQLTADGRVQVRPDGISGPDAKAFVDMGDITPVKSDKKVATNKIDTDRGVSKSVVDANSGSGGTGPVPDNIPSQTVPAR